MAQIKIELSAKLVDGMDIKFKAPCDCSAITGLLVHYLAEDGTVATKTLTFRDAHGNDLTGIGNLFSSGAVVKAIVDVTNGYAYLQNADTNAYLEEQLKAKASGSIATYFENGATDESKFEAWLDSLLDSMPDNSFCHVNISLRPILPGTEYFGTLFKSEGRHKAVLRATCYGANEIVKTYYLRGDWEWSPIEFVNPQMMLGVEYRTTERYEGHAVYAARVNLGEVAVGRTDHAIGITATRIARTSNNPALFETCYAMENYIVSTNAFINDAGSIICRVVNGTENGAVPITITIWYTKD